ncbi:YbaB/EbfC family nucleoid-associated protein [Streptomyces sp. NPDC092952]|uniref:YbaB/EbfC family nucleoid-associated protein n=1 Tax=Streptomyces sp. NPDC092952 TaxID=3366018 RepID=UPI0038027C09
MGYQSGGTARDSGGTRDGGDNRSPMSAREQFESILGSTLQEQFGEMQQQVREHAERLAAVQRELAARTSTVRSKDRSVSVTVGARGDVREIKFHTEDYRQMDPVRLGKTLVDLIGKAQTESGEAAREAFEPLRGKGDEMRRSMLAGTPVEEFLAPLREMAKGAAEASGSRRGKHDD